MLELRAFHWNWTHGGLVHRLLTCVVSGLLGHRMACCRHSCEPRFGAEAYDGLTWSGRLDQTPKNFQYTALLGVPPGSPLGSCVAERRRIATQSTCMRVEPPCFHLCAHCMHW